MGTDKTGYMEYLGEILTGLAAMLTAIVTFLRYKTAGKRMVKTVVGNKYIYDLIHELADTSSEIVSCSVIEYTNGGGIPEVGKPLYVRSLFSTDAMVVSVYSEKVLLTNPTLSLVSDVIRLGKGEMQPAEFKDDFITQWASNNNIVCVRQFLIGIDANRRVLALACNLNTRADLDSDLYLRILQTGMKIKRSINEDRQWYRKLYGKR